MKKIVINNCYGGFNLSDKAIERLSCTDNPTKIWDIARDNSTLVSLVEELGEEANGKYSELKIVENFAIQESESFDVFESEDTLSILDRYIQEAEITLDKSIVQKMIQEIYQEACEMV
jgi:hypothetical protein